MIVGDIALSLIGERARELIDIALPYAMLFASFAFIGGVVAAGIVH